MENNNIRIMRLSGTKKKGKGSIQFTNKHTLYYSGFKEEAKEGVAIIVTEEINSKVIKYKSVNLRIIMIALAMKETETVNIIQIYGPVEGTAEEEITDFYSILQRELDEVREENEATISILRYCQTVAIHGFTDHCLVSCKIGVSVTRFDAFPKTYRHFKYFNYGKFNADLVNAPFCLIFDADDIDTKVSIFNEVFHTLLDKHAPRKMCMIKGPQKPWVTTTMKLMQKLRDKAFSKFKSTRNADHFAYYKELRNLTTSAIKREKKAYRDHCVTTASSKSLWSRLRNLHVVPTRNNSVLPKNLSNVDELNTFIVSFSSADLDFDPHISNLYNHARRDISSEKFGFFFHPVSEDDVLQFTRNNHPTEKDQVNLANECRHCLELLFGKIVLTNNH
ncbi:hypothetical protein QE152_g36976 [Popillia japonica]|uniref:Uncharacterized protein n=1 Tax=Popillia japonica TaxID=7064 RepID=A0AAW1IC14_POPJA